MTPIELPAIRASCYEPLVRTALQSAVPIHRARIGDPVGIRCDYMQEPGGELEADGASVSVRTPEGYNSRLLRDLPEQLISPFAIALGLLQQGGCIFGVVKQLEPCFEPEEAGVKDIDVHALPGALVILCNEYEMFTGMSGSLYPQERVAGGVQVVFDAGNSAHADLAAVRDIDVFLRRRVDQIAARAPGYLTGIQQLEDASFLIRPPGRQAA